MLNYHLIDNATQKSGPVQGHNKVYLLSHIFKDKSQFSTKLPSLQGKHPVLPFLAGQVFISVPVSLDLSALDRLQFFNVPLKV